MFLLECNDGTFGYNCEECHKGCKDGMCEKFSENGHCSYGCYPGYKGNTCAGGNVFLYCPFAI